MPLPEPEVDRKNPNYIKIKGERGVYLKLLMPKVYNKSTNSQRPSPLFQYISSDIKKGKISKFSEEQPTIVGRNKPVVVCSESINKVITRKKRSQEYLLVSDRIF